MQAEVDVAPLLWRGYVRHTGGMAQGSAALYRRMALRPLPSLGTLSDLRTS
jgi:hypothetical protein